MAASLLIGPSEIAATGWPGWRSTEGFKPEPDERALGVPAEFVIHAEAVVAGRAVLGTSDAYRWLRSTLEQGIAPSVGPLPEASATLSPAAAPIRVGTHSQTEAGKLGTWLARPISGFHFHRTGEAEQLNPGRSWTFGDNEFFNPAMDLLGIAWFEQQQGAGPEGLLLGRFERRAWLVTS